MRLAKKRPVVSSTLLEMRMSLLLGGIRSFCQRWFTFWMMGCNQCVKCCIYWDCYQTECHFAALPKSNSGWRRLWLTSKSNAILLSCKHCRRWLQQLFTPTGGCTMLIVVGRSKFLIRVVQWLSLSHKSPSVWAPSDHLLETNGRSIFCCRGVPMRVGRRGSLLLSGEQARREMPAKGSTKNLFFKE